MCTDPRLHEIFIKVCAFIKVRIFIKLMFAFILHFFSRLYNKEQNKQLNELTCKMNHLIITATVTAYIRH